MLQSGRFDYAATVIKAFGTTHFVFASIGAPFWGLYSYFGFYEMMTNLVERPELVELLLERLTLHHLEYLKAYAAVGIDGVWIEDCYSSADLISLNQFRRFAAPYVKRLIDAIHNLGMKSIYYFCGDVSDRLEDLVAMQPTCLSLEESKKGFVIDIASVDCAVCGKVCLFGNVDAIGVLQNGTQEQMAKEIERQVIVGRRSGRFVLSLGSPVTPRTHLTKVRGFVELSRRLGK
jgi:uroporphyrinogen-III decarboxylase